MVRVRLHRVRRVDEATHHRVIAWIRHDGLANERHVEIFEDGAGVQLVSTTPVSIEQFGFGDLTTPIIISIREWNVIAWIRRDSQSTIDSL